MGSPPLAALAVQPPKQQDPITQYVQLKQFQAQQQAMQLENQQRSQQVQMGQQDLTDRAAMTQAWKNWDGKSPDSLIQGVLSAGGSGNAANQLSQQLMARQQQHMQLDTDAFNLQQKRTDRMLGRFTAAESVPDDQLAAHVQSAIADSVTSGDLQPQEAQMGYQLLQQSGSNPQALRQGLDIFQKSHQLDSMIASRAKEAADTAKAQAETQKAQTETQFMKQMGGATPEAAGFMNYLNTPAGPGELPHTPANYKAFQSQQEASVTQPFKIQTAQAEGQARAQVQLAMEPIRLQMQQQFGNQKDARDKIESSVLKPFQDKMTDIQMARAAISQAQDNPVAARAAVFKMIGVAQPTGSHRVLPVEVSSFQYPGGITDQIRQRFNAFLTGEPWTPEIAQAANSFIDSQEGAQRTQLNSGIDRVNQLYGTQVGGGLKQTTAPATGATTRPQGRAVRVGGKIIGYTTDGKTMTPVGGQ